MDVLEHLNQVNDVEIKSVYDDEFASFGRVLSGYDFTDMISYMRDNTDIPENGNVYVASVEELERFPVTKQMRDTLYGGMDIQVGYCNGRNNTYNGFEYHKGSEINVAVCDFMLVLGHSYEIRNNSYDISQATVFFVPEGTAIEMYQTTLHLSPLRVSDEGFRGVVVLPRGTNTPLSDEEKAVRDSIIAAAEDGASDCEAKLLLQRNKWVIAHPEREPLIKQGAHPGVTGVNKELFY
ncbi:MAG: DUF4867 family protein [Lachnospiraceae bacterium]|nr:DUF4867 family protein [Lachnospiraceae bacterium]